MALALTIFAIVLASLALGVQLADLRRAASRVAERGGERLPGPFAVNDNASTGQQRTEPGVAVTIKRRASDWY